MDNLRAVTPGAETPAESPPRAITFDVDPSSFASLQLALPGWRIEQVHRATVASLVAGWNPGPVDLLIVGVQNAGDSLGLCRFLSCCTSLAGDPPPDASRTPAPPPRLNAPLLVLMPADQHDQVAMLLTAGADSCLMLPIHHNDVASMLVRARQGNQEGRHTLDLERAQKEDPRRDNGGQG